MPRPLLPAWLRRGLEAAVVAAIVAIVTLAGERLSGGGTAFPLPSGPTGALLLGPAVFALGVLPATYPVAMAATRSDALLGAIAAWLLAVDLTLVVTGGQIALEGVGVVLPTAVLVGLLGLLSMVAGLVACQLAIPLGFGRRAGGVAAAGSAVGAVVALLLVGLAA